MKMFKFMSTSKTLTKRWRENTKRVSMKRVSMKSMSKKARRENSNNTLMKRANTIKWTKKVNMPRWKRKERWSNIKVMMIPN